MTIDVLPGKSRSKSTDGEPLPIGEADANIFDCPACRRPLGVGVRRCPGCRTRLLSGARATTVLSYGFGGLVIGLLAGGGLAFAALTLSPATVAVVETPVASAAPIATAATVPTAAPVATVAPVAPVVPPSVPTAAVSALTQATRLNDRLLLDAGRLSAALAAGDTSSAELARILRSLSANASFGDRLQPSLAGWDDAAPLTDALDEFYASVMVTAQDGLDASLLNERAYVDASERMVVLLEGLAALDEQARAIAAEAGLELPPLSAPDP